MVNFIYSETIEKMIRDNEIKILTEESLENIRGLSLDTDILINLSANQWKLLEEAQLISEIGKTIIHEFIHYILKKVEIDIDREEEICKIMAEQIIYPIQIETFI